MGNSLFDDDDDQTTSEWTDMPEFVQPKQEEFAKVIVRFRNEEDLNEFQSMLGQLVTRKTKSIWHPKLIRGETVQEVWVDDFFEE